MESAETILLVEDGQMAGRLRVMTKEEERR
jgi:hypothetical protein